MRRRTFLGQGIGAVAALSLPSSPILGANEDVRVAGIGMGSFVKIGGKGRADMRDFHEIPGVRVVSVCDCDSDNLGYVVKQFEKRGERVRACADFRKVLDDPGVDAVCITTPNHWHSLMTILACQAGKDVFVQKPSSHNIFEGRKMVEAARKYRRIVQATHGRRGGGAVAEAYEYLWAGNLGKMLCVHGINYKPRTSIGKVSGPQPVPAACDYDLWCGPAPTKPLRRKYLHYDWHWDWDTGNGDLGNMGIHFMDSCRWATRQQKLPRRVISVGGRLAYDDDGETPNTLITLLDYEPAPIIFEVRGLPKNASYRQGNWEKNAGKTMDTYRGVRVGTVVRCEGGFIKEDAAYDNDGKLIKKFTRKRPSTKRNFIDAVRSRKRESLFSEALEGHLSCGLVHLANISYRVGKTAPVGEIREAIRGESELSESLDRLEEHLAANQLDLGKEPLVLGPVLTLDPEEERFVGAFSEDANRLRSREYREPFVVPETV